MPEVLRPETLLIRGVVTAATTHHLPLDTDAMAATPLPPPTILPAAPTDLLTVPTRTRKNQSMVAAGRGPPKKMKRRALGMDPVTPVASSTRARAPLLCLPKRTATLGVNMAAARPPLRLLAPMTLPAAIPADARATQLSRTGGRVWREVAAHTTSATTKKMETIAPHRRRRRASQRRTCLLGTSQEVAPPIWPGAGPLTLSSLGNFLPKGGRHRPALRPPAAKRTGRRLAHGHATSRTSTATGQPVPRTARTPLPPAQPAAARRRRGVCLWDFPSGITPPALKVLTTIKKTRQAPPLPLQQQVNAPFRIVLCILTILAYSL